MGLCAISREGGEAVGSGGNRLVACGAQAAARPDCLGWAPGLEESPQLWLVFVLSAARRLGRWPQGPWAFGRTLALLPWQGDRRGATPWLPALLQPTFPWGGHPAVGEVCEEPIPPLAAGAPALPVCTARLAGAPATGLPRTHRLLPSWVGSQASLPLCPASAAPRPATPLPARVGNHGAPVVGTCWLGNGAPRFGPETGQSERALEQSEEGETARVKGKVGASSARSAQALWLTGTQAGTSLQHRSP